MAIEREELDELFNSPNNDVKDGRVKVYENSSKQTNDHSDDNSDDDSDEHLDEELNNILSNKRPSILEDALKNKTNFSMVPTNSKNRNDDDDEEIVLNDLNGSEDLNFTKKDKKSSSNSDVSENKKNSEQNTVIEDEKPKYDNNRFGRVPFDFDGIDDEDSDKEDNSLDIKNCESSDEKINKNDLLDESISEENSDIDNEEQIEDDQSKDELTNKNISNKDKEEYSAVCSDSKYLSDPRYYEFYKQKLRAYKFLKENVPDINYNKLREQIKDFYVSVNMDGVISLDKFNEKIQQVQSVRNRLTQVRSLCIQNYVPKKRIIKMLEDCLMKESSERSNDKRAGEVQIHLSDMEYDMALTEAFMKDVEQIMENITCAHEALSRQITVLQERNKEIQRGEEPYIDTSSDKHDSILSSSVLDEEDGNSLVKINKKWKKI